MKNPTINRRGAMQLAGGGILAATLSGGRAAAQETDEGHAGMDTTTPLAPGWRRFRIGEASVTQILDGIRIGDGPHPTFGQDQPAAAVAALMRENGLPESRFVNFFGPTIVETGEATVLIDTGFGETGRPNGMGLLRDRMLAAGLEPAAVTHVALTHLHGDHIGGLLRNGEPAFANAEIVVGEAEYAFWTSDAACNGPTSGNSEAVRTNVVPLEGTLRRIGDGDEVAPGLTARAAFGHTPGMLAFELVSGEARLMLTADIFGQFVVSIQRPDWHVQFDMDKEAAAATRRRFLQDLADSGTPLTGYHLPFPGIGTIERAGDGFRFRPESYALLLEG